MLDPVGSCNYVPARELGVLTKQQCKQQQIKTETTQPLITRCELNTVVYKSHCFMGLPEQGSQTLVLILTYQAIT